MQRASSKPNVVLISLDDVVAFWKYKCVFGEELQTPNLDRICSQSTAFHAAYCQAPVCSPSRASFMSGLSPHQTGITTSHKHYVEEMPAQALWPAMLKQAGYFCSSGGKVVQGYTPLPKEVHRALYSDHRRSFSLGRRKRKHRNGRVSDDVERIEMGGFRGGIATVDPKDDRTYYDHQVAESACDFFDSYDGAAPFYREVGMRAGHGPWNTPLRFKEMYNERNIHKPRAWLDGFDTDAHAELFAPENMNLSQLRFWKKSVRNYFSAMTHFDTQLGRIWDALKSSRHADNTVVVILSDHGMHLGEHNRFRKHTLWEQVANVPLIIHDPTRPVAQVVSDPVALLDVGPTVLDWLGLPIPDRMPGRSLRPLMRWQAQPPRAIPTFYGDNVAIRWGQYRMIRCADGSTQFYDLAQDWWQTRDMGRAHPDFAATYAQLERCCAAHGFDDEAARQRAANPAPVVQAKRWRT